MLLVPFPAFTNKRHAFSEPSRRHHRESKQQTSRSRREMRVSFALSSRCDDWSWDLRLSRSMIRAYFSESESLSLLDNASMRVSRRSHITFNLVTSCWRDLTSDLSSRFSLRAACDCSIDRAPTRGSSGSARGRRSSQEIHALTAWVRNAYYSLSLRARRAAWYKAGLLLPDDKSKDSYMEVKLRAGNLCACAHVLRLRCDIAASVPLLFFFSLL
jgi:hypothetical protein